MTKAEKSDIKASAVSATTPEDSNTATVEAKEAKPYCFILLVLLVPIYFIHILIADQAAMLFRLQRAQLNLLWPILPGFAIALIFCKAPAMEGLQTIFHELRHAAIVILSGSKLVKFEFYSKKERKKTGTLARVRYRYSSGLWGLIVDPLIATAPYYFPLLSLPLIAVCSFLPDLDLQTSLFAIGLALGIDLGTALNDFLNVNNLGKGDFAYYRAGFTFGCPFVLGMNIILIEFFCIWLQWKMVQY